MPTEEEMKSFINLGKRAVSVFGDLISSAKKESGTAAKHARSASGVAGRTASRAGYFVFDHPRTALAGAAGAALYATHPLKRMGIFPAFQEEVLGDQNAFGTIAKGVLQDKVRQALYTPGETNARDYLTSTVRAGPPMVNGGIVPGSGPYTGPSGDIVFGLYNLRQ